MIGQVSIGKSFGGVVRYVMEKSGAKVLDQFGVRSQNPALATQDFNAIRSQRSGVKNAVCHASISFAYEDKINEQLMIKIGREYLDKMKLRDHQYLMVQHHDTKHEHIHIISNRIGFDGDVVTDKWCKNRTASICDSLEEKYGFTVARKQRKKSRIHDKVPLKKQVKNDLHLMITQALKKGTTSFDLFEAQLKSKNVEVLYQIQKTGRVNGISFKHRNLTLKGSSIDKSLSYKRIAKALDQNNRQSEDQSNDKR